MMAESRFDHGFPGHRNPDEGTWNGQEAAEHAQLLEESALNFASPPTNPGDGWIHHRGLRWEKTGAGQRIVESSAHRILRDDGCCRHLPNTGLWLGSDKRGAGWCRTNLGQGVNQTNAQLPCRPGDQGASPTEYVEPSAPL